ncbi:chromate efflux transporter [Haladaptatus halobius]|uniref:chromate efflux transporter n=1 Tax=Haladaptatus halobius TaxID=2884875 RepID=UPI001D0A2F7A|nr:chromate efflux transporter [Haladaptatus halobius]
MGDDTVAGESATGYKGTPSRARLLEVAAFFLKIGLVGFGGPLVHIAMMEDELVGEGSEGWTDESTFAEGLAICNVLPGPASTQLGIFMGWIRAGTLGALVAGATFMLPTFTLVVGFSYLYFAYGRFPATMMMFYGINPVVIGLIVGASYSMARSALGRGDDTFSFSVGADDWSVDWKLLGLLVGALTATVLVNPNPVLEFVVAGVAAVAVYRTEWLRENPRSVSVGVAVAAVGSVLYVLRDRLLGWLVRLVPSSGVAPIVGAIWGNLWLKLFLFMLYTGSFIYGGGLVLIPFIEKYVVGEFGWLSSNAFVDGIAIGQLTPGPVVMTTAFVGYELMYETYGASVFWGVVGAFVAAVGAFAPSFVFIMGLFPYVARIRENEVVQVALTGINAAVVGAIVGATVTLAREALVDPFTTLLAVVTFALFVRGVDAAYLIVGGGVAGLVVGSVV